MQFVHRRSRAEELARRGVFVGQEGDKQLTQQPAVRVAVIGSERSGKSALVARLRGHTPSALYDPTTAVQSHVISFRSSVQSGGGSTSAARRTQVQLLEVPRGEGAGHAASRVPPEVARDAVYASSAALVLACDPQDVASVAYAEEELARCAPGALVALAGTKRDAWPPPEAASLREALDGCALRGDERRGAGEETRTVVLEISAGDMFGLKGIHAFLTVPVEQHAQRTAEAEAAAAVGRARQARQQLAAHAAAIYVPPAARAAAARQQHQHQQHQQHAQHAQQPGPGWQGAPTAPVQRAPSAGPSIAAMAAAAAAAVELGGAVSGFYSDGNEEIETQASSVPLPTTTMAPAAVPEVDGQRAEPSVAAVSAREMAGRPDSSEADEGGQQSASVDVAALLASAEAELNATKIGDLAEEPCENRRRKGRKHAETPEERRARRARRERRRREREEQKGQKTVSAPQEGYADF